MSSSGCVGTIMFLYFLSFIPFTLVCLSFDSSHAVPDYYWKGPLHAIFVIFLSWTLSPPLGSVRGGGEGHRGGSEVYCGDGDVDR